MRLDLKSLRDTARGSPCALRITGVCNHNPETSVWCHANSLDAEKGMGIKALDVAGAIGCSACHAWLDHGPASFEEKMLAFFRGMIRTYDYLFRTGQLAVCPPAEIRTVTRAKRALRVTKGRTARPSKVLRHPGTPA